MPKPKDTKAKKVMCPVCKQMHPLRYKTTGTNKRRDITSKTMTVLKRHVRKTISSDNHQFRRKDPSDDILGRLNVIKEKLKAIVEKNLKAAGKKATASSVAGGVDSYINNRKTLYMLVPDPIQVHHLITIGAVGGGEKFDETWYNIFYQHGYDINCAQNAVVLPGDMLVACHFEVPVHKGGHDSTCTKNKREEIVKRSYVLAVISEVSDVKKDYKKKKECEKVELKDVKAFHKRMLNISNRIYTKVINFKWFISSDGYHYDHGCTIGCFNQCRTIEGKRSEMEKSLNIETDKKEKPLDFFFDKTKQLTSGCPDNRNHKDHGCKSGPIKWNEVRYQEMPTDEELGFKG